MHNDNPTVTMICKKCKVIWKVTPLFTDETEAKAREFAGDTIKNNPNARRTSYLSPIHEDCGSQGLIFQESFTNVRNLGG